MKIPLSLCENIIAIYAVVMTGRDFLCLRVIYQLVSKGIEDEYQLMVF